MNTTRLKRSALAVLAVAATIVVGLAVPAASSSPCPIPPMWMTTRIPANALS